MLLKNDVFLEHFRYQYILNYTKLKNRIKKLKYFIGMHPIGQKIKKWIPPADKETVQCHFCKIVHIKIAFIY